MLWPCCYGGAAGHLVVHLGLACLGPVVLVGLGLLASSGLLLLCTDKLFLEPHNGPPAIHRKRTHSVRTQTDETCCQLGISTVTG